MEKTNEKRNMMKRIMMMLCAVVVAISTVLGSGVTEVQAATKVSSSQKKQVKKYINHYLKSYLEYGVYLDWNSKTLKFNDKRKTDIAIYNLAFKDETFQSQYVDNDTVRDKYGSYAGGVYKYSKKAKSVIKKRGKKLFGNSYKISFANDKSNTNDLLYFFPISMDGKVILPNAPDTGDYYTKIKYQSIKKISGVYVVKIKMAEYCAEEYAAVPTGSKKEYTIKLKPHGNSFTIKSITMK